MEIPGKGSLDLLVTNAGDLAGQVRARRALDKAAGTPSEQAALEKSAKEFEGVFLNTLLNVRRFPKTSFSTAAALRNSTDRCMMPKSPGHLPRDIQAWALPI